MTYMGMWCRVIRRAKTGHSSAPKAVPKMRRAGRTDVGDLQVTVNELTPVSEPLYAVA